MCVCVCHGGESQAWAGVTTVVYSGYYSAVSVGSRREPPPSRWERSLPSGLPSAPSDLPSGGPPIGRQPHPMGGWHLSMGGPTGVSKGARPRSRWEGQREGQRESRREHGAGHDVTTLLGSELSEAVSTAALRLGHHSSLHGRRAHWQMRQLRALICHLSSSRSVKNRKVMHTSMQYQYEHDSLAAT